MGFAEGLTLVFIVLKLLEKIDWSWGWILSPMWIVYGIIILIAIIAGIILIITKLLD